MTPAPCPRLPDPVFHENGDITIALPLPPQSISPNGRRGESKIAAIRKARAIKQYRGHAKLVMASALAAVESRDFAGYSLAFHFRTRHFRDDDNADASVKCYRDGICDALQVNDKDFRKLAISSHHHDPKCPRVEIRVVRGNVEVTHPESKP